MEFSFFKTMEFRFRILNLPDTQKTWTKPCENSKKSNWKSRIQYAPTFCDKLITKDILDTSRFPQSRPPYSKRKRRMELNYHLNTNSKVILQFLILIESQGPSLPPINEWISKNNDTIRQKVVYM